MARPASTKEWHVIGRGFNGWHAKGVNVSSSGGDVIERTYWTGERMAPYQEAAFEGALVYDASECEADDTARAAFIHHVVSGPMCDPSLPADAVKRFNDRETARMMLPALGGAFATFAAMAQDAKFSGLDYVGVGVFESILRAVPLMKIGHVRNGAIIWEG